MSSVDSSIDSVKYPLLECVPNFSEGRDASVIECISNAINAVEGVKVLHVDMGYDANRTVITFAGTPQGIEEAAFEAIRIASGLIDMRMHSGTHPRMGAVDVMPIIPIADCSMDDAIAISYRLSQRVADELHIPIYNYEQSARTPLRQRLEQIRQGEYEGLESKMSQDDWQADYGTAFNAKSGATVLGARHYLLAYNVNLATRDIKLAKHIAAHIRESGQLVDGVRIPGCFKGVKAIGWDVPEYVMVQVSTNITNTNIVSLHHVYEKVKELARAHGVEVAGSELIGLAPKSCMLEAGRFYKPETNNEISLVEAAVHHLGLASVVDFTPQERIIEYLIH